MKKEQNEKRSKRKDEENSEAIVSTVTSVLDAFVPDVAENL